MRLFYKWFKKLIAIFFFLFFLSLATVVVFAKFQRLPEKVDAGIILGAAINSPALYNRTMHGLNFLETGKFKTLVLSGGKISDSDISEAGYMRKVILKNLSDRPPLTPSFDKLRTGSLKGGGYDKLILEESSRNTFENIRNSKEKIPDAQSVVLVSDEYHLARASLLAWRLGFKQVYWSAPESSFYPKIEIYFHYFREAVALLAYLPRFLFGS